MKVIVSRQELQAALLFASQDETRYVLNGVNIETRKDKRPLLISTDGRCMAVIESQMAQDGFEPEDGAILLSVEFLKPLLAINRTVGGKNFPWIEFETKANSKGVKASFVGVKFSVDSQEKGLIDGNYPNWRMVVPNAKAERTPAPEIAVNPAFISGFAQAAKLIGNGEIGIRVNITSPTAPLEVLITGAPNFYGVVMPLRCEHKESRNFQPEFLTTT